MRLDYWQWCVVSCTVEAIGSYILINFMGICVHPTSSLYNTLTWERCKFSPLTCWECYLNRIWRAIATDTSQLRSWQFDDDLPHSVGTKASATPMQPKTPLPKHWVNPTTHSPFSAFKTPKSLLSAQAPSPIRSLFWASENRLAEGLGGGVSNSEESGPSPRTPSPVQPVAPGGAFLEIVMSKMKIGRWAVWKCLPATLLLSSLSSTSCGSFSAAYFIFSGFLPLKVE